MITEMTEREKIEKFMEEYHRLFDEGKRAIAFSSNGDFFYYELNERYRHEDDKYDVFVRFNTVEELRSIIKTLMIDSVAENMFCGADDLFYSMQNISTKKYDLEDFDYKTEMRRLLDCMEVIRRQTKILMDSFGEFYSKEIDD